MLVALASGSGFILGLGSVLVPVQVQVQDLPNRLANGWLNRLLNRSLSLRPRRVANYALPWGGVVSGVV